MANFIQQKKCNRRTDWLTALTPLLEQYFNHHDHNLYHFFSWSSFAPCHHLLGVDPTGCLAEKGAVVALLQEVFWWGGCMVTSGGHKLWEVGLLSRLLVFSSDRSSLPYNVPVKACNFLVFAQPMQQYVHLQTKPTSLSPGPQPQQYVVPQSSNKPTV